MCFIGGMDYSVNPAEDTGAIYTVAENMVPDSDGGSIAGHTSMEKGTVDCKLVVATQT
jgi:hypothetical protein